MSRQIDITQKLTDEEVAYLKARDRHDLLDANALHLMGGGADEGTVEEAIAAEGADENSGTGSEQTEQTEVVEETTEVTEVVEETTEVPADETPEKATRKRGKSGE